MNEKVQQKVTGNQKRESDIKEKVKMPQRKSDKGRENKDNCYSQEQGNKYDRDVNGHS